MVRFFLYFHNDGKEQGLLLFDHDFVFCQTTLAEQHMERICSLESALRQRETSLQKLSAQLRSKDAHQSQLHASLDVPRGLVLFGSKSLKIENMVMIFSLQVAGCADQRHRRCVNGIDRNIAWL